MKTTPEQRAEMRPLVMDSLVDPRGIRDKRRVLFALRDLLDDLDEAIAVLTAESARVGELAAKRDALAAKLDRVRALHAPTPLGYGDNISRWDDRRPCAACGRTSPCPTVDILDADGGES